MTPNSVQQAFLVFYSGMNAVIDQTYWGRLSRAMRDHSANVANMMFNVCGWVQWSAADVQAIATQSGLTAECLNELFVPDGRGGYHATPTARCLFELAGKAHDLGKIHFAEIYKHAGKLSVADFERQKAHTTKSVEIIEAIALDHNLRGAPWGAAVTLLVHAAHFHHENDNGTGYHGLCRDQLPLAARLLRVIDPYEALVNRRPYKEPVPPEKAVDILQEDVSAGKIDAGYVMLLAESVTHPERRHVMADFTRHVCTGIIPLDSSLR